MLPDPFRNVLVLTGPTGAGKTQLALEVAERRGAEIISMDSMAVYRGMDIGTAKPTADERRRVPHHLLDEREPWQAASVAWWLDRARTLVREIEGRGKGVLIVGGTPLYLKALLHGLFEAPPADHDLRERLHEEAKRQGPPALHERLSRVDPVAAARLHPNDLRRVVRALEVWELTGRPISAWQTQWPTAASGPQAGQQILCLDLPRAELNARIDARVHRMVAEGLVDEVQRLRALPQPLSPEAAQAVGYKEVGDFLDGLTTRAEVIARVQTRSRQFAKRQRTWFRHLPQCRPVSRELTFALWGLTIVR